MSTGFHSIEVRPVIKQSVRQWKKKLFPKKLFYTKNVIHIDKPFFCFGFKSHQHSRGHMANFQPYWWKKTSGAPSITSGTNWQSWELCLEGI
jgi:hypothetical protein